MDGINFPGISNDWFATALIALIGVAVAGILVLLAEKKITSKRGAIFIVGILGFSFLLIFIWYNMIGIVMTAIGDQTIKSKGCIDAFPIYKQAVRWNPKFDKARSGLVKCGLELKRSTEVLAIMEPLQESLSDVFIYRWQMSWVYFDTGIYDKMINSVEIAANLKPKETEWIAELGEQLHRKLKFPEAEAVLRVARVHGDDGIATFWLAWALYEQHNKYDDALYHFDECIRLNISGYFHIRCIAGKGFVLRDSGRYDEAKSLFETSLQMDPNQDDVKTALGQLP